LLCFCSSMASIVTSEGGKKLDWFGNPWVCNWAEQFMFNWLIPVWTHGVYDEEDDVVDCMSSMSFFLFIARV
jgi:hypothetical protein